MAYTVPIEPQCIACLAEHRRKRAVSTVYSAKNVKLGDYCGIHAGFKLREQRELEEQYTREAPRPRHGTQSGGERQ